MPNHRRPFDSVAEGSSWILPDGDWKPLPVPICQYVPGEEVRIRERIACRRPAVWTNGAMSICTPHRNRVLRDARLRALAHKDKLATVQRIVPHADSD